jgi:plasmid maintenance system antidote protein VapI
VQLSTSEKPTTLADVIRAATQPKPHRTIAQLAADAGVKPWHINKILGGRNLHLTVEMYEGLRKALGLSRAAMDRAMAASREALCSSPVSHKSSKSLATNGKGQKP